jgi:carbon storage regulator CsrA
MLVLSRKVQQQILIPDLNIRITVLTVGTNRVQLGIEAPAGIQITRPEVVRAVSVARSETRLIDVEVAQHAC